jgi:uncharacterized repeat protein (TIGR03803 family)
VNTGLQYINSIRRSHLQAPSNALLLIWALGTAAALHAQTADKSQAGTYSLLYSFGQSSTDACAPLAGLVRDSSGNLYGTTASGGQDDEGTVFKVTPGGAETVLHSFAGFPSDGAGPEYGSLTLDAVGNLYGTTPFGGELYNGTLFRVTATGTESVLYNFCADAGCTGADGYSPYGGVASSSHGSAYGLAFLGGTYGLGALYTLTAGGTESVIHSFEGSPTDGANPLSNLIRDSSGNLYGTTSAGGASNYGTVFEVTAGGTEIVLYSFKGYPVDGEEPSGGGLLRDTSGNLYGVTQYGGNGGRAAMGAGVVFKLTPGGAESVLLNFNGTTGGKNPMGGLAIDAAGNLYGTGYGGGSGAGCERSTGCGTLFELTTAGKEIVLHNFVGNSPSDGASPYGGVLRDPSGNLYGTLSHGGAYGCGAIFKFTP